MCTDWFACVFLCPNPYIRVSDDLTINTSRHLTFVALLTRSCLPIPMRTFPPSTGTYCRRTAFSASVRRGISIYVAPPNPDPYRVTSRDGDSRPSTEKGAPPRIPRSTAFSFRPYASGGWVIRTQKYPPSGRPWRRDGRRYGATFGRTTPCGGSWRRARERCPGRSSGTHGGGIRRRRSRRVFRCGRTVAGGRRKCRPSPIFWSSEPGGWTGRWGGARMRSRRPRRSAPPRPYRLSRGSGEPGRVDGSDQRSGEDIEGRVDACAQPI